MLLGNQAICGAGGFFQTELQSDNRKQQSLQRVLYNESQMYEKVKKKKKSNIYPYIFLGSTLFSLVPHVHTAFL